MIKQGAVGGFLVTTSSYYENVIEYAKGLKIERVDGEKFVELWLNALGKTRETFIPVETTLYSNEGGPLNDKYSVSVNDIARFNYFNYRPYKK